MGCNIVWGILGHGWLACSCSTTWNTPQPLVSGVEHVLKGDSAECENQVWIHDERSDRKAARDDNNDKKECNERG